MRSVRAGKLLKFALTAGFLMVTIFVVPVIVLNFFTINNKSYRTSSWIDSSALSKVDPRDRNAGRHVGVQSDVSSLTNRGMASPSLVLKTNKTSPLKLHSYDGHDFLTDSVFKFDQRYKNPCWHQNQQLKCLPYFYVIGVKKCGTSELFKKIIRHPDVIHPGFKEAQFFARKRFGHRDDITYYINMFQKAAKTIEKMSRIYFESNQISPFITGEGSPSNLHFNSHWMYLPGNEHLLEPRVVILDYINHFNPNAKLIIIFRDPIERLYSDYYHEYGTLMKSNEPNPQQFHEVVSEGVRLYKRCFEKRSVRSCVYDPALYQKTKVQMQLGIYYIYWQELLRVFRRDQILVLQNRNLNSTDTMEELHKFLELRPLPENELKTLKGSKKTYQRKPAYRRLGHMFNSTFDILYEFYQPFNKKMAEITQDATFLYNNEMVNL